VRESWSASEEFENNEGGIIIRLMFLRVLVPLHPLVPDKESLNVHCCWHIFC